jgi:hypothetical protein
MNNPSCGENLAGAVKTSWEIHSRYQTMGFLAALAHKADPVMWNH